MYCTKCGNQLADGALFCSKCGAKVVSDEAEQRARASLPPDPPSGTGSTPSLESHARENETAIKKYVIPLVVGGILAVMILILGLNGTLLGGNSYINMVKGGHPTSYPNTTYEKAYRNFFANPKWQYFKSEAGQNIVQFDGDCTWNGDPAHAVIQFDVDAKNNTFSVSATEIDGVPQNIFSIMSMQDTIFSDPEV